MPFNYRCPFCNVSVGNSYIELCEHIRDEHTCYECKAKTNTKKCMKCGYTSCTRDSCGREYGDTFLCGSCSEEREYEEMFMED